MGSSPSNFSFGGKGALEFQRFRFLSGSWLPFRGAELQRTFWALADQGVISLGTFLTTIGLARTMQPSIYGTFVLIIGVMLFINALQNGVIGYPLVLRGASVDDANHRDLTVSALALTALLALPFSVAMCIGIVIIMGMDQIGLGLLVGLALLTWQLQSTTRNGLVARNRFRGAIIGDSISFLGQALAIWTVAAIMHLPLFGVFALITITSVGGMSIQANQLRLFSGRLPEFAPIALDFWSIGRWALLAAVVTGLGPQILLISLTVSHGASEVAKYQAALNLLGVTHPVMMSLANLIVPAVALATTTLSIRQARTVAYRRSLPIGLLLLPFFTIVFIVPGQTMSLLYGTDSPYSGLTQPVRWLVLGYALFFTSLVLTSFLNAIEKPRAALFSNLIAGATTLTIGAPLTVMFGVTGATAGICAVYVAWSLAAIFLVRRAVNRNNAQHDSSREHNSHIDTVSIEP